MRDWFRNYTLYIGMRKSLILLPSHSVRVRGLKFLFDLFERIKKELHSVWMRGLKYHSAWCTHWPFRCILHGCVDWNGFDAVTKSFGCILCEFIDWNIVVYCAFVNIPWICRLKCSLRRLVKIFIVIISWQIKLYML